MSTIPHHNVLDNAREKLDYLFKLFNGYSNFGVSGGHITNLIFNDVHNVDANWNNDIDVFVWNNSEYDKMREVLMKDGYGRKPNSEKTIAGTDDMPYNCSFKSEHFIKEDKDINLILSKNESAKNILQCFDIIPCAIMICRNKALYLGEALEYIAKKELIFRAIYVRKFQERLNKYVKRGFSLNTENAVKVLICLDNIRKYNGGNEDVHRQVKDTFLVNEHFYDLEDVDDFAQYDGIEDCLPKKKKVVVDVNKFSLLDLD